MCNEQNLNYYLPLGTIPRNSSKKTSNFDKMQSPELNEGTNYFSKIQKVLQTGQMVKQ